jgi:hypothetical protein
MHTIRLRHPWQCEPSATGVCWSRFFNWPAGIQPREKARLVIEGMPDSATVALRGKPLTAGRPGEFDVTESLSLHNRLTICLADGTPTGGTECPFDVRLDIFEG